jgi:hypothetical protein
MISLISRIQKWWVTEIYANKGLIAFILLLILTLVMFIPVMCILLGVSVFMAFGKLLVYCLLVDMAIYLVRILLGKSFVAQFLDRYYRLFPVSGQKHREKSYEKWLKANQKVFEGRASFYEDEDGEDEDDEDDEDYEDFYEDSEDDGYDGEYDDEYYEDYPEDDEEDFEDEYDEYDDEEYGEYGDDYDDDYDDDYPEEEEDADSEPEPVLVEKTTFDFFAGCNSKESVDRKYKSLVKLYHPDNEDGDTAALQEINIQYTNAKKKFS